MPSQGPRIIIKWFTAWSNYITEHVKDIKLISLQLQAWLPLTNQRECRDAVEVVGNEGFPVLATGEK